MSRITVAAVYTIERGNQQPTKAKFAAARKAAAEGSQQLAEQFLAQGQARLAAAERM